MNKTKLMILDTVIVVQYYKTDILVFRFNEIDEQLEIVFDTGGWMTRTTRRRMKSILYKLTGIELDIDVIDDVTWLIRIGFKRLTATQPVSVTVDCTAVDWKYVVDRAKGLGAVER